MSVASLRGTGPTEASLTRQGGGSVQHAKLAWVWPCLSAGSPLSQRPMITYEFVLDGGPGHKFQVDLDRLPGSASGTARPPWTLLTFKQCPNCPLSTTEHSHCPVALDLEEIVTRFRGLLSFQEVTVNVHAPERSYSKRCDVQTGLRSLVGLVMATSGCPILGRFRSMAYYHLPFSNVEETLFRTVGSYLLKQYFIRKAGGEADLDLRGLARFYEEVQEVSQAFKARVDAASERDANMNALGTLILLGMVVSSSLDEQLKELQSQFSEGSGGGSADPAPA